MYSQKSYKCSVNKLKKIESMQYLLKMFRLLAFIYCFYAVFAESLDQVDKKRIIGGKSINIEDVPYQVSIIYAVDNSLICGGSIISEEYVLTAAHCAILYAKEYKIRSGSSYFTSGGMLHNVTTVTQHESFRMDHLGKPANDVALMKVSPAFKFNGNTVKKIELFEKAEKAKTGDEALLAGWGFTAVGRFARHLQSLKLEIMDTQKCFNNYREIDGIRENQICAEYPSELRDICKGDSGGALVVNGRQVGIASWTGPGCAQPGRPGVYTELAAYRDWIDKHVQA